MVGCCLFQTALKSGRREKTCLEHGRGPVARVPSAPWALAALAPSSHVGGRAPLTQLDRVLGPIVPSLYDGRLPAYLVDEGLGPVVRGPMSDVGAVAVPVHAGEPLRRALRPLAAGPGHRGRHVGRHAAARRAQRVVVRAGRLLREGGVRERGVVPDGAQRHRAHGHVRGAPHAGADGRRHGGQHRRARRAADRTHGWLVLRQHQRLQVHGGLDLRTRTGRQEDCGAGRPGDWALGTVRTARSSRIGGTRADMPT